MNLIQQFSQHLKSFPFIQKAATQLLAVSGGIDSVVLCDLMHEAGYNFVIAHCNFQLRGAESQRDEMFVRQLAKDYNRQIFVEHFNTREFAAEHKVSIQVAARQLRYAWFNKLLQQLKTESSAPAYVITAHHAGDSIETLLMNFFKGTGIAGLHGIQPLQQNVFRPLLFAKKEQLQLYAAGKGLAFVEDSSNSSDKYTRNFIRQQVMPKLKELYPTVEDNLLQNINRFSEVEMLYKQSVELQKKKLLEYKENEVHIPVLKLLKVNALTTLLFEIVKDFGFTTGQVPDIIALLHAENGKHVASPKYRIIKNQKWLIITPQLAGRSQHFVIDSFSQVTFSKGVLNFKEKPAAGLLIPTHKNVAALSGDDIRLPLLLRRPKPGDYFYPLGLGKKQKLTKFFNGQKLSVTARENTWVLEMDKKIIWVVGQRIDNRFKIRESTTKALIVEWTAN